MSADVARLEAIMAERAWRAVTVRYGTGVIHLGSRGAKITACGVAGQLQLAAGLITCGRCERIADQAPESPGKALPQTDVPYMRPEDAPCCRRHRDTFGRMPIGYCTPECGRRPENRRRLRNG